jgi:hypothetical protein
MCSQGKYTDGFGLVLILVQIRPFKIGTHQLCHVMGHGQNLTGFSFNLNWTQARTKIDPLKKIRWSFQTGFLFGRPRNLWRWKNKMCYYYDVQYNNK